MLGKVRGKILGKVQGTFSLGGKLLARLPRIISQGEM